VATITGIITRVRSTSDKSKSDNNNNNNKSLIILTYTVQVYPGTRVMLKIYIATITGTMLVSNLPCRKFEKNARMPMACMLNVHNFVPVSQLNLFP